MPNRILTASTSLGGGTLTAWKRRSSERSFSMDLRYSAGVVAPMHWISPRDLGEDAAHVLVVGTQHRKPIERQIVEECDEALLEPREISVMRRQMIVVDV